MSRLLIEKHAEDRSATDTYDGYTRCVSGLEKVVTWIKEGRKQYLGTLPRGSVIDLSSGEPHFAEAGKVSEVLRQHCVPDGITIVHSDDHVEHFLCSETSPPTFTTAGLVLTSVGKDEVAIFRKDAAFPGFDDSVKDGLRSISQTDDVPSSETATPDEFSKVVSAAKSGMLILRDDISDLMSEILDFKEA